MVLKVIGSSSDGNGYVLDNGNEALFLEAGVRLTDFKKTVGFNIRKVVGCLVTHRHNDHAKYIKSMVDCGFPTLALPDVWQAKNISGSNAIWLEYGKGYKFGKFKVLAFAACHDVPCAGYLIEHPDCGRMLFLTDSCMCEYRFSGLNHILIECNYSDLKLSEAINDGRTLPSQRERLMTTHMELNTCKMTLAANDLHRVSEIVLLHLSDNNSDEKVFQTEIERQTGRPAYIASPGLCVELNKLL